MKDDERERTEDEEDDSPPGEEKQAEEQAESAEPAAEEGASDTPDEPQQEEPGVSPELQKIIDMLTDEPLEAKIDRRVEERERIAATEKENEQRMAEMQELVKAAEDGDDEALAKLGNMTLERIRQARVEAPIREKVKGELTGEFRQQLFDGLDATLEALGLTEAANAVLAENPTNLRIENFKEPKDWVRAVVSAVQKKAQELSAPTSESDKAAQRRETAARAQKGSRTPDLPGARPGDEPKGDSLSARDYILAGRKES